MLLMMMNDDNLTFLLVNRSIILSTVCVYVCNAQIYRL